MRPSSVRAPSVRAVTAALVALVVLSLPLSPVEAGKKKKQQEEAQADATFAGWYAGVEGYEQALAVQRETGRPLLVYFHAPWCPYCRRVNRDVLSTPVVGAALADLLAVQVNGEAGRKERKLMIQLGAEIYPTLFIRRSPDGEFERVEAFQAGELRAAEAFAASLRGAVTPR